MISGGELVVRTLLRAGVEHVFTLYGGHLETVFQACRTHGLPVLDVRHEAAAGHAAEGYARAKRTLGVCMVTAGPGFTNVITSITNAYLDRTPVLYIAASAPLSIPEANIIQGGFDQVAVAKPITKWAHRVTAAKDIPRLLAHAIRIATSHPTGPVLLDIPVDISFSPVEEAAAPIPNIFQAPGIPEPPAADIDAALALLQGAERPVILAGEGAWQCGAEADLLRLAEASGIPIFTDYWAHGLIPSSHRCYGGGFFQLASLTGQRPDALLALGVRFGVFTLGADRLAPASAKLIHVETDPKEIGRVRAADVGIVADSKAVLRAINERSAKWRDVSAWRATIANAQAQRAARFASAHAREAPPIHPIQAAAAIVEAAGSDAIFIGDGAEAHHWLVEMLRQEKPSAFLTHGHLGATGDGLGLALGAQIANPGKRVICVTGDGAVGFLLAEFDTMARHNLPIVTIVMNNRSWGATKHWQDAISGANRNIAVDLGEARYDLAAAALGCDSAYVTRIEQLTPALAAAFASGRPTCINVEIELSAMPPESESLASYA